MSDRERRTASCRSGASRDLTTSATPRSRLAPLLQGFIGEMLDWEAPTGGYLLTACYASGLIAGRAAVAYLRGQ